MNNVNSFFHQCRRVRELRQSFRGQHGQNSGIAGFNMVDKNVWVNKCHIQMAAQNIGDDSCGSIRRYDIQRSDLKRFLS